jgi:hypothetical protein
MPRTTFTHKTASDEIATRTSATKTYTHVVVDAGDGAVLRWSENEAAATKAVGSRDLGGKARAMRVEAINGGEREAAKPKRRVRRTASAKKGAKAATPKKPTKGGASTPAPSGFIDKALMEKAIELRGQGKTMKEIGVELNVKATAYLAKKIKDTFGADALDRPRQEA